MRAGFFMHRSIVVVGNINEYKGNEVHARKLN